MKGSPVLRAVIAFFFIALFGVPIRALTRTREAAVESSQTVVNAPKEATIHTAELRLSFTAQPKSLKVMHLRKELLSIESPEAEVEKELSLEWPADGVDLRFQVEWPADRGTAAMRVRISGPDGEEYDQSVWGEGATDEVLTFK